MVFKAFNDDFDYDNKDLIILHKDKNQDKNEFDNLYMIYRHETEAIPPINLDSQYEKQPVLCITTGDDFTSIMDAEKYFGIKKNSGTICRCCQGKIKYAGRLTDGTKLIWCFLKK